jgi:hypothetical protein
MSDGVLAPDHSSPLNMNFGQRRWGPPLNYLILLRSMSGCHSLYKFRLVFPGLHYIIHKGCYTGQLSFQFRAAFPCCSKIVLLLFSIFIAFASNNLKIPESIHIVFNLHFHFMRLGSLIEIILFDIKL